MSLINQYFSADHDRLDCLYAQFKAQFSQEPNKAKMLFEVFSRDLFLHIKWEEQVLFPFFEENTGMQCGPTKVMTEEHQIIKSLLDNIHSHISQEDTLPEHDLASLEAILIQHNQKEENILYPMIDQISSDAKNAELFIAMSKLS